MRRPEIRHGPRRPMPLLQLNDLCTQMMLRVHRREALLQARLDSREGLQDVEGCGVVRYGVGGEDEGEGGEGFAVDTAKK